MNGRRKRHYWTFVSGVALAALLVYWLLAHFDYGRLLAAIRGANPWFVLLIAAAIIAEQWVRAWKWRQLLYPLRSVSTRSLFGATMASYVPGLVGGFGTSALVRAWLVGRQTGLKTGAVLASLALDRLIDAVAFAVFTAAALSLTHIPGGGGALRVGMAAFGALNFVGGTVLLLVMTRYRGVLVAIGRWRRFPRWLPERLLTVVSGATRSFSPKALSGRTPPGAVWPLPLPASSSRLWPRRNFCGQDSLSVWCSGPWTTFF